MFSYISDAKIMTRLLAASLFLVVWGCGTDDGDQQNEYENVALLTDEQLIELFEQDQFQDVIISVKALEERSEASDSQYLLSARAHVALLDPIGASLELEKIGEPARYSEEFLLWRSRVLFLEGNATQARRELQGKDFTGDLYVEAELLRGDIAYLQEEFETAKAHYTAAINANSQDARVYIARAQSNLALGLGNEAEADALAAVELEAENTLTQYTLGVVYSRAGRFEEAEQSFLASLQYFASNVAARLELINIKLIQSQFDEAENLLDQVYEIQAENKTAIFYSQMLSAIRGNDEGARAPLGVLLATDNDNPQARRLLGHVAYRLGEDAAAQRHLEYILSIAPFDRVTRLALGEVYMRRGLASRALTTLEPLTETNEKNDLAAFSLASQAAAETNDMERAIRFAERTIELAQNPETVVDSEIIASSINNNSIVVFNRQLATYHFQNNDTEKAIATLERLLDTDDGDTTSAMLLSNYHMQNEDFDAAMGVADELVLKNPESAAGYNARGAVLHRQGKNADALESYSKAIELNGNYVSARQNRGALRLAMDDFNGALEDLEIVLSQFPGDHQTQLMYARAMTGTGQARAAIEPLEKLSVRFPNSARILQYLAEAFAKLERYDQAVATIDDAMNLAETKTSADLNALLSSLRAEYIALKEKAEAEAA